jgi:hypothetical protein
MATILLLAPDRSLTWHPKLQLVCRTIPNAMCFSFAILLWEILSLKRSFQGYSPRNYYIRVVEGQERQSIKRWWPPLTRLVMKDGQKHDPQERPDISRVAGLLRGDMKDLSSDSRVMRRTEHMRDSFRLNRGEDSTQEIVM